MKFPWSKEKRNDENKWKIARMFDPGVPITGRPTFPHEDDDSIRVLPRAGAWRANTIKKLSVIASIAAVVAISLVVVVAWNPFGITWWQQSQQSHVAWPDTTGSGTRNAIDMFHGNSGSVGGSGSGSGSGSTSGGDNSGQDTTTATAAPTVVMPRDANDYNPYDPVDKSAGGTNKNMKYQWPYTPVKLLEDGQVGPNGRFVDTNSMSLDSLKSDEYYDLSNFNCNGSSSDMCLGAEEWYRNLPEKIEKNCGFRYDSDNIIRYTCLAEGDGSWQSKYAVDKELPPAYVMVKMVGPTLAEIATADNFDLHATGKPVTVNLALIKSVPESSSWYGVVREIIDTTCKPGSKVIFDVDNMNPRVNLDDGRSVPNGILYCEKYDIAVGYKYININRNMVLYGVAVIDPDQCHTSEFAAEYWARKAGCGGGPAP